MKIEHICKGCGDKFTEPSPNDICAYCKVRLWPDPTPKMLETPEFNAIWDVVKSWDVNVPHVYSGYCGANGNHVAAILNEFTRRGLIVLQNKPLNDLQQAGEQNDRESL